MKLESLRAAKFLIFGLLATATDFGILSTLMMLGAPNFISKTAGYFVALGFTYLFVGRFVFESSKRLNPIKFLILYFSSGSANIVIFVGLYSADFGLVSAFVTPTASSAMVNFLGLRILVRRESP
mgnify:CR=1 FL=1